MTLNLINADFMANNNYFISHNYDFENPVLNSKWWE